jgi:hypothetical protein
VSGGGRSNYRQTSFPSSADEGIDWSQFEKHPDGHGYPQHQIKLVLNIGQGNTNGKYWDVVCIKGRNRVIASVKDHDEADLIARDLIPLPKKTIKRRSLKKLEVTKIKEIRPKGFVNTAIPTPGSSIFENRRHPEYPTARTDWLKEQKTWVTRVFANKKAAIASDETYLIDSLEHLVDGNEATRWKYETLNAALKTPQR